MSLIKRHPMPETQYSVGPTAIISAVNVVKKIKKVVLGLKENGGSGLLKEGEKELYSVWRHSFTPPVIFHLSYFHHLFIMIFFVIFIFSPYPDILTRGGHEAVLSNFSTHTVVRFCSSSDVWTYRTWYTRLPHKF